MISKEIEGKGWYTVDLHVHTPSSKLKKEAQENICLGISLMPAPLERLE